MTLAFSSSCVSGLLSSSTANSESKSSLQIETHACDGCMTTVVKLTELTVVTH